MQSDEEDVLSGDVAAQLFRSAPALRVGAGVTIVLGLLPGMPKLPFLLLGGLLLPVGSRAVVEKVLPTPDPVAAPDEGDTVPALLDSARVEPLELHLAPDLLDLLDPARGGNLMDRIRALRKRTAGELGVVVPPVRTQDAPDLPHSTYAIHVHGVEVGRGEAPAGCCMVLADGDGSLDAMPGRATVDPVFGLPAAWVREEMAEVLAAEGATVIDRASVLVTHLAEVVRRHAGDLLGRQDVQVLVDAVKSISPTVAGEIAATGSPSRRSRRCFATCSPRACPSGTWCGSWRRSRRGPARPASASTSSRPPVRRSDRPSPAVRPSTAGWPC